MRCDSASPTRDNDDPECASTEDINKFINDIEVQIWTVSETINFYKFGEGKPTNIL